MHIGLSMECDHRPEVTQHQAFDEAFSTADTAEELGFDGVWLAERHFAAPWSAAASIVSAPLVLATAIAMRTSRIGVLVLPLGLNILVGLRGMTVSELVGAIRDYRASYSRAGYPGEGQVMLRVPVYVADSLERALAEPQESAMSAYARLQKSFTASADKAGTAGAEERARRADSLATVTYDDLLRERLAYGTPGAVADRLVQWRNTLGLSGFIIESNVGGQISQPRVLDSIRLFAEEVAPALR